MGIFFKVAIKNLWLNRNIKQAIDDRRIHHQQYPEALAIENEFDFVSIG